jgi:hypothetical protein
VGAGITEMCARLENTGSVSDSGISVWRISDLLKTGVIFGITALASGLA